MVYIRRRRLCCFSTGWRCSALPAKDPATLVLINEITPAIDHDHQLDIHTVGLYLASRGIVAAWERNVCTARGGAEGISRAGPRYAAACIGGRRFHALRPQLGTLAVSCVDGIPSRYHRSSLDSAGAVARADLHGNSVFSFSASCLSLFWVVS